MDIVNLVLYKEAKRVAKTSGGQIPAEKFYKWLLEVKNVRPDIDKVLLKKANRKARKLQPVPSNG